MPVTRWADHILGPDTTSNRPDPATTPEHALYQNTTTGDLEINVSGSWVTYLSPGSSGGGGGASDLDGLTDVDTSSVAPAAGDALVFNGSLWVPVVPHRSLSDPGHQFWNGGSPYNYEPSLSTADDLSGSIPSGSLPSGAYRIGSATSTPFEEVAGAGTFEVPGLNGGIEWRSITWPGVLANGEALYGQMDGFHNYGSYMEYGLHIRESSTGKIRTFTFRIDNSSRFQLSSIDWSAYNSVGSNSSGLETMQSSGGWLRVKRNSSTSYDFAASKDGSSWYTAISNLNPGFTPDEIGFGAWRYDSLPLRFSIKSVRVR